MSQTFTADQQTRRNERQRARRRADPEKHNAYARAWQRAHPRIMTDEQKARKRATSHARYAALTKEQKVVLLAQSTARQKANPAKQALIKRKSAFKKIGIDVSLAPPKPETCSVCERSGAMCFDHCHDSNKFRGWLCRRCNTALGQVNDDPVILRKLVIYLEAFGVGAA